MFIIDSYEDNRDYNIGQFSFNKNKNLSLKKYCLPLPDKSIVLNQYITPTCVGQACAMAKMITEYILTNKWIGLSPYSIYGYYDNNGGGMGLRYGIEVLYKYGCLPLSEFSYKGDNPKLHAELEKYWKSNPNHKEIAGQYKINSYAKIKNFDEAKKALSLGMPIVGSVLAQNSFGEINNGIEPKQPKGSGIRHAICFVGWKEINNTDYLIAINSWGEGNGDNGLVYIPRGRKIYEMFAISDTISPIVKKAKKIEFIIGSSNYLVDGENKEFDTVPYIRNDRTYLPVRFVSENLGAIVTWDANTGTAYIDSEEGNIVISHKTKNLIINDKIHEMDVYPEIQNNRMMCPIRHIAEALSCKVGWNALQNKVIIESL